MRRAVIINYYFLVHKMEVENLIIVYSSLPGITSNQKSIQVTTKYQTFIHGCFKKIYKIKLAKQHKFFLSNPWFFLKKCLQR